MDNTFITFHTIAPLMKVVVFISHDLNLWLYFFLINSFVVRGLAYANPQVAPLRAHVSSGGFRGDHTSYLRHLWGFGKKKKIKLFLVTLSAWRRHTGQFIFYEMMGVALSLYASSHLPPQKRSYCNAYKRVSCWASTRRSVTLTWKCPQFSLPVLVAPFSSTFTCVSFVHKIPRSIRRKEMNNFFF